MKTQASNSANPANCIRVVSFVEHYLQPDQTFIFRQMSQIPDCDLTFVARYCLPNNTFDTSRVVFLSRHSTKLRKFSWQVHRIRQKLTGKYNWLSSRERREVSETLSSLQPHLVHAHWAPDAMLIAGACKRLEIPLLVHFHGYDVSRLGSDVLFRRNFVKLCGDMQLGITVSKHMRRRVIELGCPEAKVVAHYTGVPDQYYVSRSDKSDPSKFVLLLVGRLAEKKGHRYALQAFAEVRQDIPNAILRIVGDGPLRTSIQDQINSLGLGDVVELMGRRSPEEVIATMRMVDAVLVPSHTAADGDIEGIPNVLVEAMAAGLPVIATSHAGIPEVVRYSDPNWLVDEKDSSALADRIRQLVRDPKLRARLSVESREIARQRFHLPTQNQRIVDLYRQFVCSSRASLG